MREFRKALPEDIDAISLISVEGWKYAYKGIMSDEDLKSINPKTRAKRRVKLTSENRLSTFVCGYQGSLVGFVDFEKSRDDDSHDCVGEVWAIYILPQFIGKNFGKELIALSLQELSQMGFSEVTIWVLEDNQLARRFYERQGFQLDSKEKLYQGLKEVRYRKKLENNSPQFNRQ
ncbi:GNAT family N-acetyltransferase [Enterovibrio calviensis]|uniref:GNAT family N-acetyltransferase n=1 Tax=Enterovibrio calviensis TaxID=91359 RepID=UPI000480FEEA|nr:GNAT family N-acetyltransferase [Enterovibrio calviensis]